MTKQEMIDLINQKLIDMETEKWYTPLAFVEDMRSLVYHEELRDQGQL